MERNQSETLEHYEAEWSDLLFNFFDYWKECEKLFPMNPPDPYRLVKFIDLLEDVYNQVDEESKETIVVRENGIGDYNLPLVFVMDEKGKKRNLDHYSHQELLAMPIHLETKERMSKEQILLSICFYILYPLRVTRQKKRDGVAMLLNVICQRAEKVS